MFLMAVVDAIFKFPARNHYQSINISFCIKFLITILLRSCESDGLKFIHAYFLVENQFLHFYFEKLHDIEQNLNLKRMHIWILKICIWIYIFACIRNNHTQRDRSKRKKIKNTFDEYILSVRTEKFSIYNNVSSTKVRGELNRIVESNGDGKSSMKRREQEERNLHWVYLYECLNKKWEL